MNDIANQERQVLASRAFRRERFRRVLMALGIFSLLPTLLAVAYYGFIASAQYLSVAVVSVESGERVDTTDDPRKSHEEHGLQVVRGFITSRAMVDALSKHHDFAGHYRGADFWSRLSSDAGSEETFAYYLDHVKVTTDSEATLSIEVLAFSPESARILAEAIVKRAAEQLDAQSDKTRRSVLEPAERAVDEAKEQLLAADETAASELELGVAERRLEAALVALEVAQADAGKRKRQLMVVAEPSLASEASRPRRLWNIATVFITTIALGGLLLLLSDFVREHARL